MIPRKDALIFYTKLNGAKSSDGKVLDFSGNENNGTITGTEAYETNQFGKKAQVFDGTTDYVEVSHNDSLVNNKMSWTFSLKRDSYQQTGGIITKYNITTDRRGFTITEAITGETSTKISPSFSNDGVNFERLHSSAGFFDNSYITGTITFDEGLVKIYKNGELFDTLTYSITSIYNNSSVSMGIGSYISNNTYFNGQISNVVIHNTALSPTEVKQLYQELNNPQEFSPKIVLNETSGVYEPLVEENGLVFYTRDGVRDLTGRNTITNSGAIVGKEMVFDGTSSLDIGCDIDKTSGKLMIITEVTTPSSVISDDNIVCEDNFLTLRNYVLRITNGTSIRFLIFNSSGKASILDTAAGEFTAVNNGRYHIAAVANGTNLEVYINGVKSVSTVSYNGTLEDDVINTKIGSDEGGGRHFTGTMHKCKLYNDVPSNYEEIIKLDYLKSVREW